MRCWVEKRKLASKPYQIKREEEASPHIEHLLVVDYDQIVASSQNTRQDLLKSDALQSSNKLTALLNLRPKRRKLIKVFNQIPNLENNTLPPQIPCCVFFIVQYYGYHLIGSKNENQASPTSLNSWTSLKSAYGFTQILASQTLLLPPSATSSVRQYIVPLTTCCFTFDTFLNSNIAF